MLGVSFRAARVYDVADGCELRSRDVLERSFTPGPMQTHHEDHLMIHI